MASNSFQPFSRLPPELRDAIWDFAARPTGFRGVHYFSLLMRYEVPSRFRRHLIQSRIGQIAVLGAPLPVDKTSRPSWYNNESTYAIDGGLWGASRESHLAMRRRYNRQRKVESRRHIQDHAQEHLERSATFAVNDKGRQQYFTVLLLQDLFFIQPGEVGPEFECLPTYMPFSAYQNGKRSIRHFAMEFDPSWSTGELLRYNRQWHGGWDRIELDDVRVEVYSDLLEAVRSPYKDYPNVDFSDTTVWLVDYRLRRKSTVFNENDGKQEVFHGNGCKYYAMLMGHEKEHCAYDEETQRSRGFEAVWTFIEILHCIGTKHQAEESGVPVGQIELKHLRVLVCEKDC